MVATSDFSGLASSAWALARAAAIAPIVSLDRCMIVLLNEKIEADRARLRAPCPNAAAGGLLCVLRHQSFELGLCPFVVEKSRSRGAEEAGELRPRIGLAHVDDANCFDPWPWRLDAIGARRLSGLHTTPEPPFRRHQKVLVKRVSWDSHLNPFAPPVMIESAADRALATHMLCCSWAICFSAAASSENDQGSMNLASNTASWALTNPSSVAARHR